jgi:hypothetical protein
MRSQRGHDLLAESGDGLGILNAEPASMEFRELDHVANDRTKGLQRDVVVLLPGVFELLVAQHL